MKFGIQILILTSLAGLIASSTACSFIARSAEDYRDVTRELVSTKNGEIKDCYDVALQSDEGAAGKIVVNFTVEKKTGTIMNPSLDESSTAPPELGQCVVAAVDGLVLDPPDQRDGVAKFSWEFVAG
jgi:hypothetical protein